jgi:hypothetical protein
MPKSLVLNSKQASDLAGDALRIHIHRAMVDIPGEYDIAGEVFLSKAGEFGGFKGWQPWVLGHDAFGQPRYDRFVLVDEGQVAGVGDATAVVRVDMAEGCRIILPDVTHKLVLAAQEAGREVNVIIGGSPLLIGKHIDTISIPSGKTTKAGKDILNTIHLWSF